MARMRILLSSIYGAVTEHDFITIWVYDIKVVHHERQKVRYVCWIHVFPVQYHAVQAEPNRL